MTVGIEGEESGILRLKLDGYDLHFACLSYSKASGTE